MEVLILAGPNMRIDLSALVNIKKKKASAQQRFRKARLFAEVRYSRRSHIKLWLQRGRDSFFGRWKAPL